MGRLILTLLIPVLLVPGCERTDTELEDNPSLVDPDRGLQNPITPASNFTSAKTPDVKRNKVQREDDAKAQVTTEVPRFDFKKGRNASSQPSSAPVGPSPKTTGVDLKRPDAAPGYRLFTMLKERRAFLTNLDGERIHTWQDGNATLWQATRLLPDGDLLIVGAQGTRQRRGIDEKDRYIERRSWMGERRWFTPLFTRSNIAVRADGRPSVIQHAFRDDANVGENVRLRDDVVVTLNETGEPVEPMSLYDILSESGLEIEAKAPRSGGSGPWVNPYNASSLDWGQHEDPERLDHKDNVLLALQNQDLLIVINSVDKTVRYSFTAPTVAGPCYARFLDSGNILVFEKGIDRQRSRAYELDPSESRIVWEIDDIDGRPMYSLGGGTVERLANGNTLIVSSEQGEIFEVNADNEMQWHFLTIANRLGDRKPVAQAAWYDAAAIDELVERLGSNRPQRSSNTSDKSNTE